MIFCENTSPQSHQKEWNKDVLITCNFFLNTRVICQRKSKIAPQSEHCSKYKECNGKILLGILRLRIKYH